MLKQVICFIAVGIAMLNPVIAQKNDYSRFVNPFIGTGGHGHTYPGATTPFGMVQLSPDTRIDGSWDGCGGYHYSDSLIYGFSHTHLSGTGCTDYGDVMLMPMTARVEVDPINYASRFDHNKEHAEAGYYNVVLEKGNILAELTSTTRVGYHRYTFNTAGEKWLLLDLNHRDKLLEGKIEKVSANAIQGFRRSEAWASNQLVYFYMEFSEPIINIVYSDLKNTPSRYGSTIKQSAQIQFAGGAKPLEVKVALSGVDENGAKNNLINEVPSWGFDAVREQAKVAWNKELSKIEVSGGSADQNAIFYTALYHCMTQPNTYNDVDGRYRGRDFKIHQNKNSDYYSVFSLWDTFRGLHPLLNLIDQKRTVDFINTFITQYKEGGRLPVWELSCNETECMIGYHAVPVIAEAMLKGLNGFNYKDAYAACRHSAMMDHFGLQAYKSKGFIETDDEHESVSKTLEYSYDDWCIAQMAAMLGEKDDYTTFIKRSYSWVNLFDARLGHMRPRYNGGWFAPFDPKQVDNNFTEANSWQYSFFVPHQVPELVTANGGLKKFEAKLDELFTTSSITTGREQSDITGLIGQYAHGNEPSHHMAYLYSLIGQAPKTQKQVRFILDNFYKNEPDGLIGNEDCGQMSAWFVWSAMGMYSSCPGKSYYTIGTPLFPEVKINLENGSQFIIKADQPDKSRYYIQSATLNGELIAQPVLQYTSIMQGGAVAYKMGNNPGTNWVIPTSDKKNPDEWKFNPAPLILAGKQVFRDSVQVKIEAPESFLLTINDLAYKVLSKDTLVTVTNNSALTAACVRGEEKGQSSKAQFYKIPNKWTLAIAGKYNPQYTAGGDEGLIDGLRGDVNWRKGRWQGYQDQDVEVVLDLKQVREIDTIGASFLQDSRAWILMPTMLMIESSVDGKSWVKEEPILQTSILSDDNTVQLKELSKQRKLKARYIKLKAVNYGKLPQGHQGVEGQAFIFIDEVLVK